MSDTILYQALYNPCVYESCVGVLSTHFSKEGAEKALEVHRQEKLDEFNDMIAEGNEYDFKFGEDESWSIDTITVLP